MELFGYHFGLARRPAPRVHRFNVHRYSGGVEVCIGGMLFWLERGAVGWLEDVRALGYRFGLDRRPTPWQRGFWIDRVDETVTRIGLGAAILCVERLQATGHAA